jgi:hypothetical protein
VGANHSQKIVQTRKVSTVVADRMNSLLQSTELRDGAALDDRVFFSSACADNSITAAAH